MSEGFKVNRVIFGISAGVIAVFVLLGAFLPEQMHAALMGTRHWISENLGWFYITAVSFFLVFVIGLFLSPYGRIRLGKDDEEPEFSNFTWFAMLFSAGMGIGLLFFSVAEPIFHFMAPPRADEAGTLDAAREAMTLTFFHWGMHAWAIYIVVGMALAYFSFRHDLPLTIRSTLWPLLGRRIHGPIGYAVEILAIFGTLFGVATSLGLGVMQINAGLEYLNVAEIGTGVQIGLIVIITLVATVSVVTGLKVGIRRLSEANLVLGLLLVVFVAIAGPTVILASSLVQNVGAYLSSLPSLSFQTDVFREGYDGADWQRWWTMFYWAWWISWSPFVGMFIARISRGRTIREFVLGVLAVPTLLTFAWLTIFGGTALDIELNLLAALGDTPAGPVATATDADASTALFAMLAELPWAVITSIVAMVVIATYFVTSSDSASLVIDILSSDGDPDPPVPTRVFWAVTEGAVAGVLLYAGGEQALEALQAGAIITALPFCIIMLAICLSLVMGLRREARKLAQRAIRDGTPMGMLDPATARGVQILQDEDDEVAVANGGINGEPTKWRERLREIAAVPEKGVGRVATRERTAEARRILDQFIEGTVLPAFKELQRELRTLDRKGVIERKGTQATLHVMHGGDEEFSYTIRARALQKMPLAFPSVGPSDESRVLRAEVVLPTGPGPDYEVHGFTKAGIIEDFLEEYARWREA